LAFLNEPAQHDHVDYFQSFAKFHEKGLSSKIPAKEEAAIRRDPQLVEFENRVHQLEDKNATCSKIKAARSKAQSYCDIITRKNLQQYQLEWVWRWRDWKVMTCRKEQPDNDVKTDLLEILSLVMPELGCLTRTMILDKVVSNQVIEDLCSLVSHDCTTLYRPGEMPINGVCPVKGCGAEMIKYIL